MPSIQTMLKHVESFVVSGFHTRTQNSDEFNARTAKIPSLWQQFYSSTLAKSGPIFAVYSDYASDANGLYTYTVGIQSDTTAAQFTSVTIQTGKYLVFQGKGPMPSTVIETWKSIWDYFETGKEYQRSFTSDFEVYNGPDTVDIYIGIQ